MKNLLKDKRKSIKIQTPNPLKVDKEYSVGS